MLTDHFALTALSPLDGRYRSQLTEVATLFSEFSLIKYRVHVEVEYLVFLSQQKLIPTISSSDQKKLRKIVTDFDVNEAQKVKTIERTTQHDVKAVEYYLRQILAPRHPAMAAYLHLGLTSEDTNSLAYSLMLKTAQQAVILPQLRAILAVLTTMATQYQDLPLLARTHGQAAVPTTVGKEVINFAMRLLAELQLIEALKIEGKCNGAVGNFNAQVVAFGVPAERWLGLSQKFITDLGLEPQLFTTQILPAESYSHLFASLLRVNLILLDLNQDLWRYISDGYLVQKFAKGQVGSSTMPHKVNPIDFENSEGNLGLANALLVHLIQKLPISRLQRDLSDSTVKRSLGTAIGYSHLAYTSLLKGLSKLSVNEAKLVQELDQHWEVLTEACQVVLRAEGDTQGYEKLKTISQGKQLTKKVLHDFIATLTISAKAKQQLLALTPSTYLGAATHLTHHGITIINDYLKESHESD